MERGFEAQALLISELSVCSGTSWRQTECMARALSSRRDPRWSLFPSTQKTRRQPRRRSMSASRRLCSPTLGVAPQRQQSERHSSRARRALLGRPPSLERGEPVAIRASPLLRRDRRGGARGRGRSRRGSSSHGGGTSGAEGRGEHRHPAGAAVVVAQHVEHGSHARAPVGQQAEHDAAHACCAATTSRVAAMKSGVSEVLAFLKGAGLTPPLYK